MRLNSTPPMRRIFHKVRKSDAGSDYFVLPGVLRSGNKATLKYRSSPLLRRLSYCLFALLLLSGIRLAYCRSYPGAPKTWDHTAAFVLHPSRYVDRDAAWKIWLNGTVPEDLPRIEIFAEDFLHADMHIEVDDINEVLPLTSAHNLAVHHIYAPPRSIELPPNAPLLNEIMYLGVLYKDRINIFTKFAQHLMGKNAKQRPLCMITIAPSELARDRHALKKYRSVAKLGCKMVVSEYEWLPNRAFAYVKTALNYLEENNLPKPKWFMFGDE